jgi:hypothetical protein
MERQSNDFVELGSISSDTAGEDGLYFEVGGRMPTPGLDQE